MSRIGKRELLIPNSVNVSIEKNNITISGPKGTLSFTFKDSNVNVKVDENKILVTRKNELKTSKQLHGTTNSIIYNMLKGVSEGYKSELEIVGVGYKFSLSGNSIVITAGYSHPVKLEIPSNLKVEMPSQNELIISGCDKQAVTQFAAQVREVRKPEPYKGKGIKYKEENIRRKEGKKAA
jgi:large subunit ribosomal protein L6